MPDPVDRTLSHYRIVRALGAGGMGEVFLAHDTKLGRDVALKILPASMAGDPDRRERFAREARAIAALNHPNIVTVHSVEEAPASDPGQPGVTFLTMELIEGRTLADLIPSKGLPIDQLLKLAIPLADAVGAAHAKGITHRDLKPANVMVTSDGRLKVLDFGLAKLREDAAQKDGSITTLEPHPLTGEGRIVGTVTYMSPEQAEGKAVDHRSDIFSLGVMLYELATGDRPFKGDSNVSTLSAILRDTPKSVTEVNPALPRDLAKVIRRALTKDPEHRFQSAKDLRNELEELKRDLDSGELSAAQRPVAVAGARRGPAAWVWVAAAAVVVAAGWLLFSVIGGGQSAAPPALQANFAPVTSSAGVETSPNLSPDGKWLVYVSGGDIQLQSVGSQVPTNLTKDEPAPDFEPAFSPDGEFIAFVSSRGGGVPGIWVMTKTGESPKRLTDSGFDPAWTPDQKFIVYATATTLNPEDRTAISEGWKVEVATGTKTRLAVADFMQPAVSPHGQRVAYWALDANADGTEFAGNNRDLWTIGLDGRDRQRVTDDTATDWCPLWSPDGRYLYFSSDRGGTMNLWRVAIDEASGRVTGQPEAITTPALWLGRFTRSADGQRFAYAAYTFTRNVVRVPFDPVKGVVTGPPEAITTGTLDWYRPDPSPDGNSVVMASYHRQEDLYLAKRDAAGSWRLTQLTNDVAKDRQPRWSPDGRQIAFYANADGPFSFWTINPDGSSRRQRVAGNGSAIYTLWSPDGLRMMVTRAAARRNEIFRLGDDVVREPIETLPKAPDQTAGFSIYSWSPDGRQVAGFIGVTLWTYAFDSKEYTKIAPGLAPAWLADSRRLVYQDNGRLWIVDSVTKQSRELHSIPGENLEYPRPQPVDNRFLYFTHAVTGADVWMMTIK